MKIAVSISPSTDDDDKELFECTPPYKGEEFLWVTGDELANHGYEVCD